MRSWEFFVLGITCGYLFCWIPMEVREFREYRARKVRAEIDRIQGAYSPYKYTPITPPPPSWRERILEYWQQFLEETEPKTPELVAHMAYHREIRGIWQ